MLVVHTPYTRPASARAYIWAPGTGELLQDTSSMPWHQPHLEERNFNDHTS